MAEPKWIISGFYVMIHDVWHLCDDDGKRLLLYQKTSSSYSLTSCVWTGDSWSQCSNWHLSSKSSGSWRVWVPSIASIYLSQKGSGNTQIRTLSVFVGDEIDLLIQWGVTMLPATLMLMAVHVHALCLHPSYLQIKIYSVIPSEHKTFYWGLLRWNAEHEKVTQMTREMTQRLHLIENYGHNIFHVF